MTEWLEPDRHFTVTHYLGQLIKISHQARFCIRGRKTQNQREGIKMPCFRHWELQKYAYILLKTDYATTFTFVKR